MQVLLSEVAPWKLALMEGVDAWIQIACPRLSIDWGEGFQKPTLTPYEALIALAEVCRPQPTQRDPARRSCVLLCQHCDPVKPARFLPLHSISHASWGWVFLQHSPRDGMCCGRPGHPRISEISNAVSSNSECMPVGARVVGRGAGRQAWHRGISHGLLCEGWRGVEQQLPQVLKAQ